MGNLKPESPSEGSEPDLPSAPDQDLIRTIEEGDMSTLPEPADPSLMRRIDLEDPTTPRRVYIEEAKDDQ
jgi:hypothetical protein